VHETRLRGQQRSPESTVEVRPNGQPLDDWLGDVSDDDWSENATARGERRRASPAYQELPSPEGDVWAPEGLVSREPPTDSAHRPRATDARRAAIERRRLVAGIVAVVVLALGVAIAVLLVRDGGQAPVAPVSGSTSTTPTPGEGRPSATTTTPSSSTTPSTGGASAYALPEGVKLQRGEGDPALVEELQQALSEAGYDPGAADGNFGRRTEAAVAAFQEANGLSVDGRVGPETASALNSALAGG
jgi:hypothetical protein